VNISSKNTWESGRDQRPEEWWQDQYLLKQIVAGHWKCAQPYPSGRQSRAVQT